jgi:hypothetical protein
MQSNLSADKKDKVKTKPSFKQRLVTKREDTGSSKSGFVRAEKRQNEIDELRQIFWAICRGEMAQVTELDLDNVSVNIRSTSDLRPLAKPEKVGSQGIFQFSKSTRRNSGSRLFINSDDRQKSSIMGSSRKRNGSNDNPTTKAATVPVDEQHESLSPHLVPNLSVSASKKDEKRGSTSLPAPTETTQSHSSDVFFSSDPVTPSPRIPERSYLLHADSALLSVC